jgi:surface antigen
VLKAINASPEAQARAASVAPVPAGGLEGQHGGQCVVFVENQTGHHFPVEGAKQMLQPGMHPGYNVVGTPQPGDIFVCTGGQWGHTGIVKAVNPDGSLVVVDSNSHLDEVIHTHTVPAGYAQGYLRRDPGQATIPQN